ncbi:hypothetical protein [Algicola sagamiensis]|uniref:hypothetical protein n=1 Tax=Algicola sagamiensis TaxID=163869 RepID=UPI0003813DFA|nr:hypothetical protein [Algicola sagamiensis]
MRLSVISAVLVSGILVTGCGLTSSESPSEPEKTATTTTSGAYPKPAELNGKAVYLRTDLDLWQVAESARLQEVEHRIYRANLSLKSQQQLSFRFADKDWSKGINCGYKTKKDRKVMVGKTVEANCSALFENFIFTAEAEGSYSFFLDKRDPNNPKVYVKRPKT